MRVICQYDACQAYRDTLWFQIAVDMLYCPYCGHRYNTHALNVAYYIEREQLARTYANECVFKFFLWCIIIGSLSYLVICLLTHAFFLTMLNVFGLTCLAAYYYARVWLPKLMRQRFPELFKDLPACIKTSI